MKQTSLLLEVDSSLQAARRLIEVYVRRGDSIASLKAGQGGASSPNSYSAMIGGWVDGKRYSTDHLIVQRDMEGNEVNKVYKLKYVYDLIKGEQSNGQEKELHQTAKA